MHKLLAGLLDYHRLWEPNATRPLALSVAIRLAQHLRARVLRVLGRGLHAWRTFINQEVGGMSEALTDLALVTGNDTWVQLAALFERPCFIRPLALHYQRHRQLSSSNSESRVSAAESTSLAARAIERMHGNTHLPQMLGAMARYEATGDTALRAAAEAFWAELSRKHQYVTGGSTVHETWQGGGTLGDAVAHIGRASFAAHDVHETCVSHNSMRVSRRLMMWGDDSMPDAERGQRATEGQSEGLDSSRGEGGGGSPGGGSGPGGGKSGGGGSKRRGPLHTLEHAQYYERTMLNAVLGTQRGTVPGHMLYMVSEPQRLQRSELLPC